MDLGIWIHELRIKGTLSVPRNSNFNPDILVKVIALTTTIDKFQGNFTPQLSDYCGLDVPELCGRNWLQKNADALNNATSIFAAYYGP